jgi:ornithine cyclodeaminase/alanine dehydrogenase-like protein (mu-crystallin family)
MLILDADATRAHLGFVPLIEALRQGFVGDCEVPLRHSHSIASPAGDGTLLLMPAWRPGKRLGIKTVTVFPANRLAGRPALQSTYLLLDASTGEPLAALDGNELTARRTAAAAALAASFLARRDAHRLLVVGAGRVASLLAEAMATVVPIERVRIWNRQGDAAIALAQRLAAQGFAAAACTDLEDGVRDADVVSCATLSTAALVHGAWLAPGSHLDLIGSFTPALRESDAACFARSRVFVDTVEALAKSGDVLLAIEAGAFAASDLQGTLADLCRGRCDGRRTEGERTLFKAVGTALEDLAAAELVFDAARSASGTVPGLDPVKASTAPGPRCG